MLKDDFKCDFGSCGICIDCRLSELERRVGELLLQKKEEREARGEK